MAAPSKQQLDQAVEWALAQKAAGRGVYVHCAHGHGRSNVVLSAALIAAGTADGIPAVRSGVLRICSLRAPWWGILGAAALG